MARLPGLTPAEDRAGLGGQNSGRQSNQFSFNNPRLSPVASPVNTYSRPEQAPMGSNNWESLAQALSTFQPGIQALMNAQNSPQQQSRDAAAARAKLLTMAPEERMKAIRDGAVPELTNMAGSEVAGEALAVDRYNALQKDYQDNFDPAAGDFEKFFHDHVTQDMDMLKDNPEAMDAYTKSMSGVYERLKGKSVSDQSTALAGQRSTDLFTKMSGAISFQLADQKTPDEIVGGLHSQFTANRDLLRVSYDDQNKMLLQLADQQATAGNFDMADTILTKARKDGAYSASLMTDPKTADAATNLRDRIDKDRTRLLLSTQAAEQEERVYSDATNAAEQGQINAIMPVTITDKSGNPKVITPEEMKKEVGQRLIKKAAEQASISQPNKALQPALAYQLEKEKFIGAGVEHPVWFTAMNSAPGQINLHADSGQIPPTALDSYKTYKDLHADSPEYLQQHASKNTVEFFEAARFFENSGLANSPEGALRRASDAQKDIDMMPEAQRLEFQKIDQSVDAAMGRTWGDWWAGQPTASNNTKVKSEIVRGAKLFARGGLGPDEALQKSQELFTKTHINALGTFIQKDKRLPPDFVDYAKKYVDQFYETHKAELEAAHLDINDLTISEASNGFGSYVVRDRTSAVPLVDTTDAYFNLNSLQAIREKERQDALGKIKTKN